MSKALFSTQPKRRARTSMTLQAMLLMALYVALMQWLAYQGLASRTAMAWWGVASMGATWVTYTLVRSGWSERFSDPSLTLVQIVLAVTSSASAYVLASPARGIMPAMLAMALLFAGLNLRRWQLAVCVWYALGAYAIALLLSSHAPTPHAQTLQQLHVGALLVTVLGSWMLGARMVALRRRLHRQRQELQHALNVNRELAAHDALTGLANRRSLQALLHVEHQRCLRAPCQLLVALLDLDHFKTVNDRFGHHTGDAVLQLFAQVAKRNLRAADVVGRWGGEEFMVLMVDTELPVAQEALNRLREVLHSTAIDGVPGLRVSCSIGLTRYAHGESMEETIRRADKALYTAKHHGRNRVVVLHPDAVQPATQPLDAWMVPP